MNGLDIIALAITAQLTIASTSLIVGLVYVARFVLMRETWQWYDGRDMVLSFSVSILCALMIVAELAQFRQ